MATKYTKLAQNTYTHKIPIPIKYLQIPNGHKIYQLSIKIPKYSVQMLSYMYPSCDFWNANIPSGNPDCATNGRYSSGLPDGLFCNQKSQFGHTLEGPRLESVYTYI
jgi:hypothetical protein